MVFENLPIIGEGKQHRVHDIGDGNVLKVPKENDTISLEQAEIATRFFGERFREFVPPSKIYPGNDNIPYYVVQKKIEGKTLSDFLGEQPIPQEIRYILQKFMTRLIGVFDRTNVRLDIMGTPPTPELQGIWEGCTNIVVHDSGDALSFVDTVYFSPRMARSDLVNGFKKMGCYGSYLRQRRRYATLLQSLKDVR